MNASRRVDSDAHQHAPPERVVAILFKHARRIARRYIAHVAIEIRQPIRGVIEAPRFTRHGVRRKRITAAGVLTPRRDHIVGEIVILGDLIHIPRRMTRAERDAGRTARGVPKQSWELIAHGWLESSPPVGVTCMTSRWSNIVVSTPGLKRHVSTV